MEKKKEESVCRKQKYHEDDLVYLGEKASQKWLGTNLRAVLEGG